MNCVITIQNNLAAYLLHQIPGTTIGKYHKVGAINNTTGKTDPPDLVSATTIQSAHDQYDGNIKTQNVTWSTVCAQSIQPAHKQRSSHSMSDTLDYANCNTTAANLLSKNITKHQNDPHSGTHPNHHADWCTSPPNYPTT